jgi:cob(I)alamin adenosyltransferase
MKIYTKTGDKGTTALVGGKRVVKNNSRIEAYGAADELIAYIGLLRDHEIGKAYKANLLKIQEDLMVASAILAAADQSVIDNLPKLSEDSVVELENEMDRMEQFLPTLNSFLIPGGIHLFRYAMYADNMQKG